jgi:hypothetical protein
MPAGPLSGRSRSPLAIVGREAGQARAVAAGPSKRPAAAAQRPLGDEAQQRRIVGLAAWDLDLGDESASGVQDRGAVAVPVGIDPDEWSTLPSSIVPAA